MVTDDPERIGATIKALRDAYRWKQVDLAAAVARSRSHLSNIESGRKHCTPELARDIAKVLRVPLAAITTAYSVEESGA
ncbi:helix-turn-helix transcriptional regulator [Mycobacteroides abscessus]|uniref:helix-turn-helix transcriptional regulator n=1 Tax=Mycobacteroides abscessus TaxID=36809 RepID=UPI000C268BAC|nr:helix-turn-helix transcriptional regulator [Mycobacteroides abscessus]